MKKIVVLVFLFLFSVGYCEKESYVLLSNNGGKGQDFGLRYIYPFDKPTNPPDRLKDQEDTFGNRLLNGQPWGNWWDCIGINWKDLTIDFIWPEQHRIGLIKILMVRQNRPKLIEIQSRIQSDGEWINIGKIEIKEDKPWYEYEFSEPIWAKEVRLIFRLKEWGFYIDEVEFWGIPGYVAQAKEIPLIIEKGKLYIVKDGKVAAKIVVPQKPSEKEKKASQLIQMYIYQMTKAGLPIVEESPDIKGAVISIGNTQLNKKLGIKQGNYPEKEIAIVKRDGNVIHIAGNDAGSFSGSVRAAYLFLEHIGVKFYGPSPHWKVVPETKDIGIEKLDISLTPAFSHRRIWWQWKREDFDPEAWGLGGVSGNYSHALYSYIPPEKYFKEHPEYFALVGGKRQDRNAQICFSNPDVQRIILEKAREYFDKDPSRMMFSLSANDCGGFCECEECKKLGSNPSEQSLEFANIIATQLRKTHPDKYVIFYAYWFTAKAPENIKAKPGVFVMVINDSCKAHSLRDSNCPSKDRWIKNFLKWKQTGAKLAIYEYYIPGCDVKEWQDAPFLPGESALIDLRFWKENGVEWVFYESWHGEKQEKFPFNWLMYYTVAKGMENPYVKYEELVKQACDDLFGPASKTMAEFYIELSRILNRCPTHSGNWTPPKIQDVYSKKDMIKLRTLLAEAMKQASEAKDEVVWRINDVMEAWIRFEKIYKNLPLKREGGEK
ncbi:MAG: DUF4838 domain-containing protein [Candidatus Omnitrophica bacterium]|nr:DUF4838 domain-containing protein [Candidatus Omnitrophota bacterium]